MSLAFKKLGKSLAAAVGKEDPLYAVYQSLSDIQKLAPDSAERRRRIQELNTQIDEMETAARAESPQDGTNLKKLHVLRQYWWTLALRDPTTPATLQKNSWRRLHENIFSPASAHRGYYNNASTTVQASRKAMITELERLHLNSITRQQQSAAAASAALYKEQTTPAALNKYVTNLRTANILKSLPAPPTHRPSIFPRGGKQTRKQRRKTQTMKQKRKANTYRRRP